MKSANKTNAADAKSCAADSHSQAYTLARGIFLALFEGYRWINFQNAFNVVH